MPLSKIMVLIDPNREDQPAFDRGLDSARLTGARLHLYTCLQENNFREQKDELESRYRTLMEQLVSRAEHDGIEATIELEWAQDWSQRIPLAAARSSASMIFKNSIEHSDVQRQKQATADWTLLRLSPCPVLMVKNFRDWQHRRVLSAINIQSTDVAHIKLNNQIIGFAQRLTDAYGSEAHFVNAFGDRNHEPKKAELSEMCGITEENIHIAEGSPPKVITTVANQLGVDLIIIGTVGRTGIKGQVVGNTSEKVLDHTDADILVLN